MQGSAATGHTLSGTVIERFSGRPVAGASVSIWPAQVPAGGWPPPGVRSVRTDAMGRYRFPGLPAVGFVWAAAADTGDAFRYAFVQPCAAQAYIIGNATLDLLVSSTADLSVLNAAPISTRPHSRVVSGTVYERTATGRRPARNVWVGWEAFLDTVVAETRTDADGRYVLCGLPTERIALFAAPAYGHAVYKAVEGGPDAVVNFDIRR
jgi:hypothetical protein